MNGRGRTDGRFLLPIAATAALSLALSACGASAPSGPASTPGRDGATSPSDGSSETGDPGPGPTPSPSPSLDPDGSAAENLEYFDAVNERVAAAQEEPDGRAFIDGLIAAGFDRAAMEVTPDRTAADLAADSIQFSVRIGRECLLGQFDDTGYVSHLTGVLSTGRCLVGRTRPIDW